MVYDNETLRKLQLLNFEVLKEVDRVCRENNITYFLDSGSALGAVRHKAYIPWDDDIDIGMIRQDYDRFLTVASQALGDRYEVVDPLSNNCQAPMFTKVWLKGTKFYTKETLEAGLLQGVGIDIFPYDCLSADAHSAHKQRKMCRLFQALLYLYHSKYVKVPHTGFLGALERGACSLAHALLRVFSSHERLTARFEKYARLGQSNPTDIYLSMTWPYVEGFKKDILLPVSHCMFEDRLFPVPARAEKYLRIMYGNWEKVPPVEERVQHAPVELDFGEKEDGSLPCRDAAQ